MQTRVRTLYVVTAKNLRACGCGFGSMAESAVSASVSYLVQVFRELSLRIELMQENNDLKRVIGDLVKRLLHILNSESARTPVPLSPCLG